MQLTRHLFISPKLSNTPDIPHTQLVQEMLVVSDMLISVPFLLTPAIISKPCFLLLLSLDSAVLLAKCTRPVLYRPIPSFQSRYTQRTQASQSIPPPPFFVTFYFILFVAQYWFFYWVYLVAKILGAITVTTSWLLKGTFPPFLFKRFVLDFPFLPENLGNK